MEFDRCRDIRPHFPAMALGTADASAANRIHLHLATGCPSCAAELEGVLEAFFGLAGAPPPRPLPDGSTDALVAAAGATDQLDTDPALVYAETNERRLLWTLVGLCLLAVLAAGWWGRGQVAKVDHAERAVKAAELQARSVSNDYRDLRDRMVATEALAGLVGDPTSIVVDLFDNADLARARALLDWPRRRALLVPPKQPPPPNTTFVLWVRSGDALFPIGPIEGRIFPFALPDVPGPGVALEVYATPTDEVEAKPAAPVGPQLLSGRGAAPEPDIE